MVYGPMVYGPMVYGPMVLWSYGPMVLWSYGLWSYGLWSYGLWSYGLWSYGLWSMVYGPVVLWSMVLWSMVLSHCASFGSLIQLFLKNLNLGGYFHKFFCKFSFIACGTYYVIVDPVIIATTGFV